MKSNTQKAVFSLKEAAEYLGISQPVLLKLVRNGEIAARKPGGRRWLISRTVLDKWLESDSRGEE